MDGPVAVSVERPRLSVLVAGTPPGGICLVSAAPGYGGSTLLRQVARASPASCSTRVAPGESLWPNVAGALAGALGRRVDATPVSVGTALAGAPPMWLMVDVADGAAAEPDLEALAERVPDQIRLGIATHQEILGGPTTAGRQVEVDEALLAFDPDEAVALLPHTDVGTVASVWELTQGWAAGLLAAASPQARSGGNAAAWLRGAGADRLFHAWFRRLSPERRAFLLDTAVLDDLDADACDAVREAEDSVARLVDLARGHCYVREVPGATEAQRCWQRHPLLTAYLRRTTAADRAHLVHHSRAADWYAAREDVPAAMAHLLAAGRTEDAGHLLRRHESETLQTGGGTRALDWYRNLPEHLHGSAGLKMLRLGWGHALSGEPEVATIWLSRLQALASERDEVDRELDGEIHALAAYLASFRGDTRTMVDSARRAIDAFDAATGRPVEQVVHVYLIRGLQWSGRNDAAKAALEAVRHKVFAADVIREATLAAARAQLLLDEGHVHQGSLVTDSAERWITGVGADLDHGQFAPVRAVRAAALLERGDLDAAAPLLSHVQQATSRDHRYGDLVVALVLVARMARARHDYRRALDALREARALLMRHAPDSHLHHRVDAGEAHVRMATGGIDRAEHLIRSLPAGPERILLQGRFVLARGGNPYRTLATQEPDTPRAAAELHLLLASCLHPKGGRASDAHLRHAAQIATEHGMGLLLTDASPAVLDLAQDLSLRHPDDGLARLLAVARQDPAVTHPPAGGPPLSPGERELLAHLPTRATVADIADGLGVTKNTVKTRLRRLYRKLGVHTRDEAVHAARTRGLL